MVDLCLTSQERGARLKHGLVHAGNTGTISDEFIVGQGSLEASMV